MKTNEWQQSRKAIKKNEKNSLLYIVSQRINLARINAQFSLSYESIHSHPSQLGKFQY